MTQSMLSATVGLYYNTTNVISNNSWDMFDQIKREMCQEQNLIPDDGDIYCNSTYDSVTCWPTTHTEQYAIVSCPPEYRGIPLNIQATATKFCFANGTWQVKANYSQCVFPNLVEEDYSYIIRVIFYVGYTISTVALLIALFLFYYFRSLWCLRNSIHCHLMVTFVLKNILWIVMHNTLTNLEPHNNKASAWACRLIVACFNYIQSASFFWMFVEGLYLHTMIVWAYAADKVRLWKYALIGWGAPLVTIVVWVIVKVTKDSSSCCCWLPKNNVYWNYIYIGPVLVILLVNLMFLGSIEYVLITKLRANNSMATRQYKKAAKGTVILFPLLGIIYVLLITEPGSNSVSRQIFLYFNSILQSIQGLLVAVFYCFLNGEVRNTVRNRWGRWSDQRTVATTYSRQSRASIHRPNEGMPVLGNSVHNTSNVNVTLSLLREENDNVDMDNMTNSYKDNETGENEMTALDDCEKNTCNVDGITSNRRDSADITYTLLIKDDASCLDNSNCNSNKIDSKVNSFSKDNLAINEIDSSITAVSCGIQTRKTRKSSLDCCIASETGDDELSSD